MGGVVAVGMVFEEGEVAGLVDDDDDRSSVVEVVVVVVVVVFFLPPSSFLLFVLLQLLLDCIGTTEGWSCPGGRVVYLFFCQEVEGNMFRRTA